MDEKLYYEVNVTTSTDIRNAYEYAIANNIKHYRCIAKDGTIYGWDGSKYVKAQLGQEWFENPEYKEPENAIAPHICPNERVIEEKNKPVKTIAETEIEEPVNQSVNEEGFDYKALYEEQSKILNTTQDEVLKWINKYNDAQAKLDSIENAFLVFAKELRLAADKIEKLNTEE